MKWKQLFSWIDRGNYAETQKGPHLITLALDRGREGYQSHSQRDDIMRKLCKSTDGFQNEEEKKAMSQGDWAFLPNWKTPVDSAHLGF